MVYAESKQYDRKNNHDGEITEFPIPTPNSGPVGITSGPDGALWFVQIMGNRIGRITTSGEIKEFEIPTPNARPHAIVSGTNGDLWFTEWGGNKIGRITIDGKITEYPIPTKIAEPHGITVGADGDIWFAEECNQIGRLILLPSLEK